jgi:hypothetical protein
MATYRLSGISLSNDGVNSNAAPGTLIGVLSPIWDTDEDTTAVDNYGSASPTVSSVNYYPSIVFDISTDVGSPIALNGDKITLTDAIPEETERIYLTARGVESTDTGTPLIGGLVVEEQFSISVNTVGTSAIRIDTVEPRKVQHGTRTQITIKGSNLSLGTAPEVTVDDVPIDVVSFTESSIVATAVWANFNCCPGILSVSNGTDTDETELVIYKQETPPSAAEVVGATCYSKPTVSLLYSTDVTFDESNPHILVVGSNTTISPPNAKIQYVYADIVITAPIDIRSQYSAGTVFQASSNKTIPEDGDKVLLTAQATPGENDIYLVSDVGGGKIAFGLYLPNAPRNELFVDPGVFYSSEDGESLVVDASGIDFGKSGLYTIDYYVRNSFCILTHIQRLVKVMEAGASIVPGGVYDITDYNICTGAPDELVPDASILDQCQMNFCGNPSAAKSLKSDGSVPMTGNLDMGGNRIINLADPAEPTDAVNMRWVLNQLALQNIIGYNYRAGEHIFKGQAVYMGCDGRIYHATKNDKSLMYKVFGIASKDTNALDTCPVVSSGLVTVDQELIPGNYYFLNSDGFLTEMPPREGFIQVLGVALAPQQFLVKPMVPVGMV